MGITKIHGLQRGNQNFSSRGEQFVITEEVLVEAESPLDLISTIVNELPNTSSGPGSTDFNPHQLTFTLKVSTHPESTLYYLDSVNGMRRKDADSNFWIIPLTYMTPGVDNERAQDVERPTAKKGKAQKRIVNPVDRPPVFTLSVGTITTPTFTDKDGRRICHTNHLPVTTPMQQMSDQWTMSWAWNIEMSDVAAFMSAADQLTNATNDDFMYIYNTDGVKVLTCASRTVRGSGSKLTEVFETPSGADRDYHYCRVGFTMIYTPNRKVDEPQISMHTLQLVDDTLVQIPINGAGTKATEPWPLRWNGEAVPWEEVNAGDISSASHLIAMPTPDSGVQDDSFDIQISDWVEAAVWSAFATKYKLFVPGSRSI